MTKPKVSEYVYVYVYVYVAAAARVLGAPPGHRQGMSRNRQNPDAQESSQRV